MIKENFLPISTPSSQIYEPIIDPRKPIFDFTIPSLTFKGIPFTIKISISTLNMTDILKKFNSDRKSEFSLDFDSVLTPGFKKTRFLL